MKTQDQKKEDALDSINNKLDRLIKKYKDFLKLMDDTLKNKKEDVNFYKEKMSEEKRFIRLINKATKKVSQFYNQYRYNKAVKYFNKAMDCFDYRPFKALGYFMKAEGLFEETANYKQGSLMTQYDSLKKLRTIYEKEMIVEIVYSPEFPVSTCKISMDKKNNIEERLELMGEITIN